MSYVASGVRRQASGVRRQASGVRRQASGVRRQASGVPESPAGRENEGHGNSSKFWKLFTKQPDGNTPEGLNVHQ
jgi:hypothetical protein